MRKLHSRKPLLITALLAATLLAAFGLAFLPAGCGNSTNNPGSPKVKVAYLGLTCEAPIFVAKEQGFYEEEGLDAELIMTDWDGLREGLGAGSFDANHTLIMYLLTAIEKQANVKITGGIHTGCLRVQVGANSPISSPKELKGKKIGVPTHLESPPHLFASRVLATNGIDPRLEKNEVTWVPYPPEVLSEALKRGDIDAVATSDPLGTIWLGKGIVKTIADQAEDLPYKDEYCCAVVVSGNLAKNHPETAAKVTRALLKAAKWVEANPTAAAELSVEKKYLASDAEVNAQAISKLRYIPGVAQCRKSVEDAAVEMKKAGLLNEKTDPVEITKRAWLDLDGVTDEWLKGIKVENVAGGGRPKPLDPARLAALFEGKSCCACCCLDK